MLTQPLWDLRSTPLVLLLPFKAGIGLDEAPRAKQGLRLGYTSALSSGRKGNLSDQTDDYGIDHTRQPGLDEVWNIYLKRIARSCARQAFIYVFVKLR